jgi:pyridoxal phosphate enzyme (YggS family)
MIETRSLQFSYEPGAVLHFPDVDVAQGGTVLLSGVSGSGKSTWLALVAALALPGAAFAQDKNVKIGVLDDLRERIEWHLIGPLQANKTRAVAEHFDWVHSVDRLKIAQRLSEQRPAHLPPLQLCLQVNISGEASKSGLAIDELPDVARAVAALPRVRLRGLMAIPAPAEDVAAQRAPHARLRALLMQLQHEGLALDTLSMGMTGDLEAAIAEGATIVRVGTAIFGAR